jgi:malate synthase
MFSIIKKFRNRPDFAFPDRARVTMTVPFMRAYTELLVKTCHQRQAHAIGGMAAFVPSRKDPIVNENALKKVREDKLRESGDGFDGTWVAHPDLVPVAKEVFDGVLGDKPHQKEKIREEVNVTASQLIDFAIPGGQITEAGLRLNLNVALQYVESWLRGTGAVAIYNLMEDAATAEISRAQVWQWINSPNGVLNDERKVTKEMVHALLPEEIEKIRTLYGEVNFAASKIPQAAQVFERVVTEQQFEDFLTLVAYEYLE